MNHILRIASWVAIWFVPAITAMGFIFLFAPLVVLVVFSFNSSPSTVNWTGFSFDWYGAVVQDSRLKSSVVVSAIVAVSSALVAAIIGATAALAVTRHQFPGKTLFATSMIAPLVLPELVLAVGLLVGSVWIGLPLGYLTLIAGHMLISLPFAFLIIRAAASALDPRLDEAAADLGAHGFQVFLRVTFPLLLPALAAAALLAAVVSFDNFIMSTFVSGVGTTTLPLQIYSMLKTGLTPKINALGALLIGANVLAVLLVLRRYTVPKKPMNT
jgi:ABC-type spermidine/putrescine transport system permease subunit II